jgi:hypothetical protein
MRAFSAVLLTAMAMSSAHASCNPEGQMRFVTVNTSPGIPKDSFASQPLVMYRAGSERMRVEEAPDTANRIHQLMVGNWPDTWIVNLLDKTGQHVKDDSPVPGIHAPVIMGDPAMGIPATWNDLEYGCEWSFFEIMKATQTPTDKHDMIKHQISDGAWRLTMVTANNTRKPWMMILAKDGKVVWAIRYTAYDHQEAVDQALFAKPEGITFTDAVK